MNRRISVGVSVALILIAITITFSVTMILSMRLFDQKVLKVKERAAMYNKLAEIDDVVRGNLYFDIDEQRLYDSIAKGYIEGLGDRDSVYLSPSQIQRRNESMTGTVVSVGLETNKDQNGFMVVSKVYKDTSAAALEIREGDVIVKIEDKDVRENGYDESLGLLKGSVGTKVNVTYRRDGDETSVDLTRELIESTSVYANKDISGIGYLRIKDVNLTTEHQFMTAVDTLLEGQPIKGLVIDVRGSFGGYNLDIVANMLNRLVPTGVIISGTYADNSTKTLYTADETSISLPIVVLIDERTVGFTELFAGVLADYDNCKTVGMTTYGKGTLQQVSMLSDGSALDLTVAILNTPVSGSYNRIGIKPDYEVKVEEGFTFSDSTPNEKSDPQLKKAVEVALSMAK